MQQSGPFSIANLPQRQGHFTFLDYLRVIASRKKMICAVTIAASVAAAGYSLTINNYYRAKVLLLPVAEDNGLASAIMSQMGGLAGVAGSLGGATQSDMYLSAMRTETVKDAVIDRLKLAEYYHEPLRSNLYAILDDNTVVSKGVKDNIITFVYQDENPKLAAAVANAFAEELQKLLVRLSTNSAGESKSFLEGRLAEARTKLAAAEEHLKRFQSVNKVFQVDEQAKATMDSVLRLSTQLATLETQLAALRQQYTEESPQVKNAKIMVISLKGQLQRLEGGAGGAIPGLGSVPTIGQDYVRLMREFKVQEALVEILTKQAEMAKINEAKTTAPVQLLQKARVPEKKSGPVRSRMVLVAALASFSFSLLLAFFLEFLGVAIERDKSKWQELKSCLSLR